MKRIDINLSSYGSVFKNFIFNGTKNDEEQVSIFTGSIKKLLGFFYSEIVQFYPTYSSAEKKISFLLKQLSYPQKRVAKQNKNVLGVYEG